MNDFTPVDNYAAFPFAALSTGSHPIAGLLTLSRLVGMICPGLHSIFAALDVAVVDGADTDFVCCKATAVDERYRYVTQAGLSGSVEALARNAPPEQPGMDELSTAVDPSEFRGSVALIIGGSRRLGEVTAKLLAAGGAHVIVSYSIGRADADRVASSIRTAGRTCEVIHYDARNTSTDQLAGLASTPTHVYYFATGPIAQSRTKPFDSNNFDEFCAFCVRGFAHLCSCVRFAAQTAVHVFYHSSVHVSAGDRPRRFAKFDGESSRRGIVRRNQPLLAADRSRFPAPSRHAYGPDRQLPARRNHKLPSTRSCLRRYAKCRPQDLFRSPKSSVTRLRMERPVPVDWCNSIAMLKLQGKQKKGKPQLPMNATPPKPYPKGLPPALPRRRRALRFAVGLSVTVALLALLGIATELASIAVLSFGPGVKPANVHHSYYRNQPWAADYWKEISLASPEHYKPYVMWRRAPFEGKYVNVDSDGLRRTVNPDCSPEARQIWIFGSSNLWGTGATDDLTIPSILSLEFSRSIGPVCVTNFSDAGWVSTQNVIQLELSLKRASRPPDFVLFDDGFADIFPIYESGKTDVHMNYENIRHLLEAGLSKGSSFAYLKETGTYRLITALMNKVAGLKASNAPTGQPARNLEAFAELTVENYLQNMKLVEALSAGYRFQYIAFWGPVLYVGNKPLTRPERSILESGAQGAPELPDLCRKTYALMFSAPPPHLIDLSDTFDHTPDDIYLDVTHVTPDGNRLIASRILAALKNLVENRR